MNQGLEIVLIKHFHNMKLIKLILQNNTENKKNFNSISLLFLLTSFIFANLFGINFYFINWNIFSIFLVPILLELVNFFSTRLKNNFKNLSLKPTPSQKIEKNFNILNFQKLSQFIIYFFDYLKRGFLLGIFLEAFKVGS